ncbi:MAG TPA: bifunctional diguanylate cyclase/phosphodiesterase [Nocardioides sp.]|nr:bifunctional diguanylate cyclase/phosphodiesterase [Nocardioides sp.]
MSASDIAVAPGARASSHAAAQTLASARAAYASLGLGLLLTVGYLLCSEDGVGSVVYLVVGAYGTGLTFLGASRVPRAVRRPWSYFALAQLLALIGDSLYTLFDEVLHVPPQPSAADVAFILEYPVFALGVLWLVRSRRHGDRAAFLDAAILSTGCIVVGWVFFIAPAAESGGATLLSQVVVAAYPAGDLLVLTLVVRLFTSGLVRNTAVWAMFGSVTTLLVADLSYVNSVVRDVPSPGWLDGFYLLSYVALGFAALHPSAQRTGGPTPHAATGITTGRLVWLGIALVVAPLTFQVGRLTGFEHGSWVVVGGGCVVAGLVVVRLADLVKDLQYSADQLAALARRDGLTGVPNRRTWDHELARAHEQAAEHGTPLTAALLDMDRFKEFNDTFGHLSGDRVLHETATAWASILEDRGFLARYGGEEFTVLLPGLTPDDALPLLERLRLAVTDGMTCSIGVAGWNGAEAPADLVARADEALYHAKRAGRDRIAVHDGTSTSVATGRAWEDQALQSLQSVYQPIVDLRTGEVVGREALSRFEAQGTAEVFARAHREGSAVVLETAALWSALAGWDGSGWLSLNTSLATLVSPQLDEVLPEDLSAIVLELTEEDIACSTVDVLRVVEALRARGARIAIDDYGVGSSNVQRIVSFRPDIVKLDMSIIEDVDTDPMRQAVVAAVLHFASLTQALVLAEGIETVAQRDTVARLGVHLGQGFLLGRPEPAAVDARPAAG